MASLSFTLLDHDIDSSCFDCGNSSINELICQSYYPTILQHGYCFEVKIDSVIVGYFMITLKSIELSKAPECVSDMISNICEQCAVVYIKYLAVDKRFQNNRIGTSILESIVRYIKSYSKVLPIRLIQLDALKEKYSWYTKRGFIAYNEADLHDPCETILMYLDCLSSQNLEAVEAYINQFDVL